MNIKSIFVLLVACLAVLSSCSDNETIHGEMIYHKGYVQTEHMFVGSSNSTCAALLATIQKQIDERIETYNREWRVDFSGSSVDSALTKADQEAVADFDMAVESLQNWKNAVDESMASKDYGPGSFKVVYVVRVWRDKTLKESEPITFEYRYQK